MNRFYVGLLQIDSQQDKSENIAKVDRLIDEAVERGADFVTMPEMWTYISDNVHIAGNDEPVPGPVTDFLCAKAKEKKIWIHGGSMYRTIPGDTKFYNSTIVYSPEGKIVAEYNKIHLYDVDIAGGVSCRESDTIKAGERIVDFDTEYCKMGLAICYDIRFPEIYRLLALRGAKVIFNPAEFTLFTGKDHWEALIRARAIENECYMICPDQIGKKPTLQTYGRSLVVDPWGNTIAKASDKEGVTIAEIDIDYVDKIRREVPCLPNRRPNAYK